MRQPTVWSMMIRIRKAMNGSQAELLSGIVEMDETYIGGKPRKRNNDKDDDGNLLVLDNPYTNEYYEYAIKQRIFENLFMAGEPVQNHLQLMSGQLRAARNNALSFVNTPDFAEMKKLHDVNRKAQYHNYYNMFKNYI